MSLKSRNKVLINFGMLSMTDLVFILLIFFLILSTLINPNALDVNLPKGNSQTKNKATISINITKDLQFSIDEKRVNFEDLENLLRLRLQGKKEPIVALKADKSIPYEEIVKIMNIANKNKYRLILSTNPTRE